MVCALTATGLACGSRGEKPSVPANNAAPNAATSAVQTSTPPATLPDSARARGEDMTTAASVAPVGADTVRGIVERVGNEPRTQFIVKLAGGAACALRSTAPVAALDGLEVVFWGTRGRAEPASAPASECAVDVTRFAVRAVSGVPATDGVLRAEGTGFVLDVGAGDRRVLRGVPELLRSNVGARIYWVGPLDRAPAAYGVLPSRL
jgi:hypothetical protein